MYYQKDNVRQDVKDEEQNAGNYEHHDHHTGMPALRAEAHRSS
jgi:hypothetical protein